MEKYRCGNLFSTQEYKNDKKNGWEILYFHNGEKKRGEHYTNGKLDTPKMDILDEEARKNVSQEGGVNRKQSAIRKTIIAAKIKFYKGKSQNKSSKQRQLSNLFGLLHEDRHH